MDVLVTGGSGAIGRYVTKELRDRGHQVTTFDLTAPNSEIDHHIQGNVTDASAVTEAVSSVDSVVHLAAVLAIPCRENPARANAVNVGGTLNVFDAAEETDTRVLYASSKSVFGAITGRHGHPLYEPLSEDAAKAPTNIYGVTKLACEYYATRYRERDVDVTALRFGLTYGPGKGEGYEFAGFIDDLIRRAHAGETIEVPGSDQCLDATYYRDIARGIGDIIDTPDATQAAYHIGSGTASPLTEFINVLRDQTDATIEPLGGLGPSGADYPTFCQLDISRARDEFGYDPQYGPKAAVNDYLSVLDQNT